MDTQVQQQIDNVLRANWDAIYPQILDRFSTVSKSDLDTASNADDLVKRIADKSRFSETYVENELTELCLTGAGVSGGSGSGFQRQSQQQQPFSRSSSGGSGSGSQHH